MKGFTLVETLVAISIVMVAIIGPFVSIQRALVDSYIARDELIGNSLAQEGVEYVRSIRDGNYLYNRATGSTRWWLYGLNGASDGAGIPDCVANSCVVDPLFQTVQACSGANCTAYPLYITSPIATTPYVYTQASGSGNILSRFTRSIQVCYMNGTSCTSVFSNEAQLTVTVTWVTEGQAYKTSVVEYLQNWL